MICAATLSLTTAAGAAAGPGPADATAAVTERLVERGQEMAGSRAGQRTPRVTVTREAGNWAFGTAVLATEAGSEQMPEGWLFLAERTRGGWQVAFEGEPRFAELSAEAPVVEKRERSLFVQQDGTADEVGAQANGDFRTGMALPTTVGGYTVMSGGPHGWGGYEQPYSAIDLTGGDQVVRAARQGTAYTMCQGWIRVIHDRGYATDYYHLWNNISTNGGWVNSGTYLGYTGTDVTCGGAASGRHVHFGLRQHGGYVGIGGHSLGKWVFYAGSAYQGFVMHGSYRVNAGGTLYNYGALGLNQAVVDANGGGTLNKRTGPGSGYAAAGSVADGATVTVSCSLNGTTHSGRYGTTSLWNRLSDGTWVSDAYLWTGVNGPINGWC
jgi:LasA protease